MKSVLHLSRPVIFLSVVFFAAGGLLVLPGSLVPVAGEEPEAVPRVPEVGEAYAFPVRSARARRQALIHWVEANGCVRAAGTLEMVSRIRGTIVSVRVREGDRVRRGDTLLTLDDGEYRLALERARVGLLGAQIEYRTLATSRFLATSDTSRQAAEARRVENRLREIENLRGRAGAIGPDLLREERELQAALAYATLRREDVLAHRSGLVMAQEMVERARRDLEATVLRAPHAGEVADCPLTAHGEVMPGQRLLTLLDLSTLLIEAGILEHDIARVRAGQSARITLVSIGPENVPGLVRSVNPLVDATTGTYRAIVTARPPQGIRVRPGMLAGVSIAVDREPEQVVVPREALLHREGREILFVVRDGRAEWRNVRTGPSNGSDAVILQGAAAGEEVITEGHLVLAHDARVSVIRGGKEVP